MIYLPKFIKKGHEIVFANQSLSNREADLFALMMARMTPSDWENLPKGEVSPSYHFSSKDIASLLGMNNNTIGSRIDPIAERLSAKKIAARQKTDDGDSEFEFVTIFKKISYKNKVLTMIPNDLLKGQYIEYYKGFSLINKDAYLSLKTEYSKRLFEILSRRKKGDLRDIPIDELKGLFGLTDENGHIKKDKKSFSNNSVFFKRCIKDSILALRDNELTSKELTFTKEKELGYKIIEVKGKPYAIRFLYKFLTNNTQEKEINPPQNYDDVPSHYDYQPIQQYLNESPNQTATNYTQDRTREEIEQQKVQAKIDSANQFKSITEQLNLRNQSSVTITSQVDEVEELEQSALDKILIEFNAEIKKRTNSLRAETTELLRILAPDNIEHSQKEREYYDAQFELVKQQIQHVDAMKKIVNDDNQSIEHLNKLIEIAQSLDLTEIVLELKTEIVIRQYKIETDFYSKMKAIIDLDIDFSADDIATLIKKEQQQEFFQNYIFDEIIGKKSQSEFSAREWILISASQMI